MRPAGFILAGGLGRRIGGDKAMRRLDGRPLVDHVIERFRPQVAALALNANDDPTRYASWGFPVIPDGIGGQPGPLAGILAGLEWAGNLRPAPESIVTAPVDAPFLPLDLVSRLCEARDAARADIAVAASAGRNHSVVALWPVNIADRLRQAIVRDALRKVETWLGNFSVVAVAFSDLPIDPFFNVNTDTDLATAARVFAKPRSMRG